MKDLTSIAHPPVLKDAAIRLRALRAADKAAVVKACNDGLVERFCFRVPSPYHDSDFDDFLAYNERFWPEQRVANWTVVDPQSDALLAMISLEIMAVRQAGEIGYWCAPWARGRGVMSAAVRLVRDWAFDDLGLERLEITTDVDNLSSQRVAQAAGFRREGLARGYLTSRGARRDNVVFGMLPADPREPCLPLTEPWLEDGRLVVRPFVPDDIPAVQAACDDPVVARWIAQLPSPYTLSDAERFVTDCRRSLAAGERARLAISDCADGELLGSISLDLTRRPRSGRDRLLGEARDAPPGRSPSGGTARHRLGVPRARPRAPRDPHVPRQRRQPGPRREARLSPRGPAARLSRTRARQEP